MTPQQFRTMCKVAVAVLSALVIAFAVMAMVGVPSPSTIVWSIWQIVFALVLLGAEFKLRPIETYFAMLSYYLGKGIFLIFLGTLLIRGVSLSTFIGVVIIATGITTVVLHHKMQDLAREEPQRQEEPPVIHV